MSVDIRKALEAWTLGVMPNVPDGMVEAMEAVVMARVTKVRKFRLTKLPGLVKFNFQAEAYAIRRRWRAERFHQERSETRLLSSSLFGVSSPDICFAAE